ncbi:MAG: Hsp70 family protein [Bacillota bacterium]|nr:Hsp70 family protein [Bacillota bacterium]
MTIRAMLEQAVRCRETVTPIRVLGIDLGTSNSVVAEACWPVEETAPLVRCLEIRQDTDLGPHISALVPSVVAIADDQVHVGQGAKLLRHRAAELRLPRNRKLFYECKNEIGTRQSYPDAPEGFRTPAEIGSHVLRYLLSRARSPEDGDAVRTVVAVPASFQTAQRADTIRAAALAGMDLSHRDLIDEPIAALLDYLEQHSAMYETMSGKTLLVFDFGGGTCDVALFSVEKDASTLGLGIGPLSVSRYHRLGGGDIDEAIVHEGLIPQLREQNQIGRYELSFEDKKRWLEPALLGHAESLKIMLCTELQRRGEFGLLSAHSTSFEDVGVQLPLTVPLGIRKRRLVLDCPKLSVGDFERLLTPFIDRDDIHARHTDYRMTASIFGPLIDGIERANVAPSDVDYCLMVGGSSLIPQVVQAVDSFLPRAQLILYRDREQYKTCVARGAALQGLALALIGTGLVRDICHETICIRTTTDRVPLVSRGTDLPYPADEGYATVSGLGVSVPPGVMPAVRIEVLGQDHEGSTRGLGSFVWPLDRSVAHGDRLKLEYRLGSDRVLDLKLSLEDDPTRCFRRFMENPLTNVVNPGSTLVRIQEIEEQLRDSEVSTARTPTVLRELAELYTALGQNARALALLERARQRLQEPDAGLLNALALCADAMGDFERADKFYDDAATIGQWPGAWFNKALSLRQRGQYPGALTSIDRALAADRQPPHLILKALILKALGEDHRPSLDEGLRTFSPVGSLSDWALGWLRTGAREAQDEALFGDALAEAQRRAAGQLPAEEAAGELPFLLEGDPKP